MDYHLMDYNTVIKRMQTYMSKFEGNYSDRYIGITKDLDESLFNLHKVEENGIWISFGADTDEIAKKVKKYFLDKNTDENPTELQENTRIVYIYKKIQIQFLEQDIEVFLKIIHFLESTSFSLLNNRKLVKNTISMAIPVRYA